jgi:hypothetical protein
MMLFEAGLIAPCGFNCALCMAYQRKKRHCAGCASGDEKRMQRHCFTCAIRNCEALKETPSGFCYDCPQYPCRRLRRLDEKYSAQNMPSMRGNLASVSMLENLAYIKQHGIDAFLRAEAERWSCECGAVLCIHSKTCPACGSGKECP